MGSIRVITRRRGTAARRHALPLLEGAIAFGRIAVFALLAVVLVACAQVAEFIPGEGAGGDGDPNRAAPADATPILPRAGDTIGGRGGPTGPGRADHELARSVVQLRAMEGTSSPRIVRIGSGVIVDAEERLILTAYPIVEPQRADGSRAYTAIAVALSPDPGDEPELAFRAEIAAVDARSQLAVLRIVEEWEGSPFAMEQFNFIAATVGETASLSGGSPLRVFGHPAGITDGTGTQAVSVSGARVVGFRGEVGQTGRAWIKTDARVPHGLAGGPVFDQLGSLLGVLVQEHYLPEGAVAHARPIELARALIDEALEAGGGATALFLNSHVPGTTQPIPGDGIHVSRPRFAEHAIEGATGRDLFEYGSVFASGIPVLHYEFAVSGVQRGETVEERWYLDGVQQDSLSSEYTWEGERFSLLTDRITAAGARGLPSGRWRLEIWIADRLRARSMMLIGIEPRAASIDNPAAGATAGTNREPAARAASGVDQLLAFFDFEGFEGVETFEWVVFRNNQRVYQSPRLAWTYGESGRTWIGFRDAEPIASGSWEFEVYADGEMVDVIEIELE